LNWYFYEVVIGFGINGSVGQEVQAPEESVIEEDEIPVTVQLLI
jgi:hypothetical protein